MPYKRIVRNAFLTKPFQRIVTSRNGILSNHSNVAFKRLIPNRAKHHISTSKETLIKEDVLTNQITSFLSEFLSNGGTLTSL